jgi:hypothetical protein
MDGVSLNVTCLVSPSAILSRSVISDSDISSTYLTCSRSLECLGDGIRALSVPPSVTSRTYAGRALDVLGPRSRAISIGDDRCIAFPLYAVFTGRVTSESELKG